MKKIIFGVVFISNVLFATDISELRGINTVWVMEWYNHDTKAEKAEGYGATLLDLNHSNNTMKIKIINVFESPGKFTGICAGNQSIDSSSVGKIIWIPVSCLSSRMSRFTTFTLR